MNPSVVDLTRDRCDEPRGHRRPNNHPFQAGPIGVDMSADVVDLLDDEDYVANEAPESGFHLPALESMSLPKPPPLKTQTHPRKILEAAKNRKREKEAAIKAARQTHQKVVVNDQKERNESAAKAGIGQASETVVLLDTGRLSSASMLPIPSQNPRPAPDPPGEILNLGQDSPDKLEKKKPVLSRNQQAPEDPSYSALNPKRKLIENRNLFTDAATMKKRNDTSKELPCGQSDSHGLVTAGGSLSSLKQEQYRKRKERPRSLSDSLQTVRNRNNQGRRGQDQRRSQNDRSRSFSDPELKQTESEDAKASEFKQGQMRSHKIRSRSLSETHGMVNEGNSRLSMHKKQSQSAPSSPRQKTSKSRSHLKKDPLIKIETCDDIETQRPRKRHGRNRTRSVSESVPGPGGINYIIIDDSSDEEDDVIHTSKRKPSSAAPVRSVKRSNLGVSRNGGTHKQPYGFDSERDFNWNISRETALEMQERLFKEAAERVRTQNWVRVETRRSSIPYFTEPIFDIATKYPDHWKWKEPYACLGLPRNAPIQQVKSQYRKLARIYHPDKSKQANTSNKFHGIATAYRKLTHEWT